MSKVTDRRGVIINPDGTPATQSAMVASTEGRGRTEPGERIGSVIVASPAAVTLSSDTPKLKGMAERKVPPSADCCGVRGIGGGPGGAGVTEGDDVPFGPGVTVSSRSAMAPRRYPCWRREAHFRPVAPAAAASRPVAHHLPHRRG